MKGPSQIVGGVHLVSHTPFYKRNGSQMFSEPLSIRKEAFRIEFKKIESNFFHRPLTIESWMHSNRHQMPKPTCIKFQVSEVYGHPRLYNENSQGNHLVLNEVFGSVWVKQSVQHLAAKFYPRNICFFMFHIQTPRQYTS